jgi:hypothetical protein
VPLLSRSIDLNRPSTSYRSISTPKSLIAFLNSNKSRFPDPLSSAILNYLLKPIIPLAPLLFNAFLNLSIKIP